MHKPRKLFKGSEEKRVLRATIFHLGMGCFFSALFGTLLWQLRGLFFPFIVGALLAYLFRPFMNAFKYEWMPNGLRVVLLIGVFFGGLVFGGYKIKNAIPNEKQKLELMVRIKYKFNEKFDSIMEIDPNTGKGNWLYNLISSEVEPMRNKFNHLLTFNKEQQGRFLAYVQKEEDAISEKYIDYYTKSQVIDHQNEQKETQTPDVLHADSHSHRSLVIKNLVDTLSIWIVMPLTFLFLLLDKGHIFRYLIRLIPNRYFELSLTTFNEVDLAIGNYLRGTFIECSLVGLTFMIGLVLVGVPLNIALSIGIIAAITNAIPFLGPVMGLAVSLAYALIAEDIRPLIPYISSDNLIFAIIGVVVIAQILDNVLFQPIILGGAVNLHPLVVTIGVIGGSMIFGFSGMLLAIPAIVIFKVVIETLYRELKAYYII